MRIGLLEGVLICFTGLLIFGTKRLIKIKESFKEAANEVKAGINQKD